MTLQALWKEPGYSHPVIRYHDKFMGATDFEATLDLWRPGDVIGLRDARMTVKFAHGGESESWEDIPWDRLLNDELIKRRVRAVSPEVEAVRFGLAIRDDLRRVVSRFGDGFYNAALPKILKDIGFGSFEHVAELIEQIGDRGQAVGPAYADCSVMVRHVLQERARQLKDDLKYSDDEVEATLAKAVANYLDERFHISVKKQLGMPGKA
jgi:hypothetical protein